jgi:hypothetical protein
MSKAWRIVGSLLSIPGVRRAIAGLTMILLSVFATKIGIDTTTIEGWGDAQGYVEQLVGGIGIVLMASGVIKARKDRAQKDKETES